MEHRSGRDRSTAPTHQQRIRNERLASMRSCWYEMSELLDQDSIVFHRGYAHSINISSGGMLLLMAQEPQVLQVLEVHVPQPIEMVNPQTLVEVCWTRRISIDANDSIFLVGVKFLFKPGAFSRETILEQKVQTCLSDPPPQTNLPTNHLSARGRS